MVDARCILMIFICTKCAQIECFVKSKSVQQGVPSGRGLGIADMDLGCSTILPGQ